MLGTILVSGIHWGFWNVSPVDKGGTTVFIKHQLSVDIVLGAGDIAVNPRNKSLPS